MLRIFAILLLAAAIVPLPGAGTADVTGRIRVIDGDTFVIAGTSIRLFGIDAPEQDQTCVSKQGVEWACGVWVTEKVRARYHGNRARCEPVDRDRYGRTVARCFAGGEDIARVLVRAGLVFAYRKYSLDYDLDEKAAAIQAAGLHSSQVEAPASYRRNRSAGPARDTRGCAIKGNISSKGTRIYHIPGQRDYARTRIRPENGERWFCSAAEAEAAGWRAARR